MGVIYDGSGVYKHEADELGEKFNAKQVAKCDGSRESKMLLQVTRNNQFTVRVISFREMKFLLENLTWEEPQIEDIVVPEQSQNLEVSMRGFMFGGHCILLSDNAPGLNRSSNLMKSMCGEKN